MKRITITQLLLFACLLSLVSCTKEKKPPAPHQNIVTAKVNGTPFEVAEIIAEKMYGGNANPNFYLGVKDKNSRYIIFIILDYRSAPQSASLDTLRTKGQASYAEGIGLYYLVPALSGNASINTVDKTTFADGEVVSGTFSFVTDKGFVTPIPYTITEGTFSVFLKK